MAEAKRDLIGTGYCDELIPKTFLQKLSGNAPDDVQGEIALSRLMVDSLQKSLKLQTEQDLKITRLTGAIDRLIKKNSGLKKDLDAIAKKQYQLGILKKHIKKDNFREEIRKTMETLNRLVTTQKKENGLLLQEAQLENMKLLAKSLSGTVLGMKPPKEKKNDTPV